MPYVRHLNVKYFDNIIILLLSKKYLIYKSRMDKYSLIEMIDKKSNGDWEGVGTAWRLAWLFQHPPVGVQLLLHVQAAGARTAGDCADDWTGSIYAIHCDSTPHVVGIMSVCDAGWGKLNFIKLWNVFFRHMQ